MKQYIKNGEIKVRSQIVIKTDKLITINPTEEMILADGWVEYIPEIVEPTPSRMSLVQKLVIEQFNNNTEVTNEQALEMATLVYHWITYINKSLKKGQLVSYDNKIYRVIQDIPIVLEGQEPSIYTAALYEVIDKEHLGTLEDPIPYNIPMEIFIEKFYIEDGIVYECTRSSGTPLNHSLNSLVGMYVEKVN